MSKVQTAFKLSRTLTEAELESIARVHRVYGIWAVKVAPSLDQLLVEYDASRLTLDDVTATLEQHGLPIVS